VAFKQFSFNDLTVIIYKRKAARSLRLSLRPDGEIRVSIPLWLPYKAGLEFAKAREEWIREQQVPVVTLAQGQSIGKAHHLLFTAKPGIAKPTSRVRTTSIIIQYPFTMSITDPEVQDTAIKAAKRALKAQAEALLPARLDTLAQQHNMKYASVSVRELKSRWGSCDQKQHIVLNYYLMQLPWDYIDYVLVHELTHTEHMNHGPEFWARMASCMPDYLERKKAIRKHKPVVIAGGLS
jgi:predicted metal-dependent hydrolase